MKKISISVLTPYVIIGTLLFASLTTAWKMLALGYVPETPANDLAKHVASILNFRDAFLDGQFVPRLQLVPASIPDIPVFQFYGSLAGFLGLPFLLAGAKPIIALILGVICIRWIGAIALYRTGKLLGANNWSASLASISYLLTPYIVSNLYGRVAIPEATAHGVIAILFYGVIRLYFRRDVIGVMVTGLSIVALSLAHPIFLLFGLLAAVMFTIFLFRWEGSWFVGLVILGGLLLASFQWMPSFLYYHDLTINFASISPFEQRYWTSLSGLFGLPRSLAEKGLPDGARLFLTPGILTIPILILTGFKIRKPIPRATFGLLLVSLIASFSPYDIWRFLPNTLWAVQFPYRLLAFVALFTSIGICLVFKNLRAYQWGILTAVLIAQSWILLVQKPYSVPLVNGINEQVLKETFASQDYITAPHLQVVSNDGWLADYANPLYNEKLKIPRIIGGDGTLLENNSFVVGISRFPENFIRISGKFARNEGNRTYGLWIAHSDNPLLPLDGVHPLRTGRFSTIFSIPNDGRALTLKCSVDFNNPPAKLQRESCPDIFLSDIEHMPGNGFVVSEATHETTTLFIEGTSIFQDGTVDLWLARPISPEIAVTEKQPVGPGPFKAKLTLPNKSGLYMLVASRYMVPAMVTPDSQDNRRLSISITHIKKSVDGDTEPLEVSSSNVQRVGGNGYTRIFKVKLSQERSSLDSIRKFGATIQLPMAFSPLIEVTQNSERIDIFPTFSGLISLQSRDLSSPIVARFKLPRIAIAGTLLGICVFMLASWLCLRTRG